ncbi:MAG: hypothetical protein Q8908_05325 [Bacteroidota bacterium]|nr:hypothetical protein [Bacteroidota bacterium]
MLYFVCLLVSCSTTQKVSSVTVNQNSTAQGEERDGCSFKKAIVINETTESKGVAAEYTWLRTNYPGYRMQHQALSFNNKKPFDLLDIITADGKAKSFFFDISNFFGKL